MAPLCDGCGEHVNTLRQQVSVMRREIKNLRQMLDTAVRAHRKHMLSLQSAVAKTGVCPPAKAKLPPPDSADAALEQGIVQTVPIGYISSCFSVKNGTPRQPTVCGPSRAELRIRQSVFNNPGHALIGLEQYSHVWILFLFHKNGHLSYKAKVKPPRLNGQRVGVYSTRSPHRPNALGQTLAKLDRIVGDTLHLSDIDMIAGTPVLDIKPYIPEYDSPHTRTTMDCEPFEADQPKACPPSSPGETTDMRNPLCDPETDAQSSQRCEQTEDDDNNFEVDVPDTYSSKDASQLFEHHNVLEEVKAYIAQSNLEAQSSASKGGVSDVPQTKPTDLIVEQPHYGEEAYSTIADWIREPPVAALEVRFTPHAEKELAEFLPTQLPGPPQSDRPRFKFLRSSEEAAVAIRGVLSADPRSVYRRTRCKDRLFFFTLDTADITCWFGQGFAEVLQVRPVERRIASV